MGQHGNIILVPSQVAAKKFVYFDFRPLDGELLVFASSKGDKKSIIQDAYNDLFGAGIYQLEHDETLFVRVNNGYLLDLVKVENLLTEIDFESRKMIEKMLVALILDRSLELDGMQLAGITKILLKLGKISPQDMRIMLVLSCKNYE